MKYTVEINFKDGMLSAIKALSEIGRVLLNFIIDNIDNV